MSYEMYEVVKQYLFEVHGVGQVRAEILKTIKPDTMVMLLITGTH